MLGVLALACLGVVGTLVGARLLLLARRTRELPELAIGLGLVFITVVGAPLSSVGRLPSLVSTPLGDAVFALGLVFSLTGIELVYVFTWRVFHASARWARMVPVLAGVALAVQLAGLLIASQRGGTMAEILPHTRPWGLAIVGMVALAFGWTAFESLRYHARLRRRLPLGLADPVVANRVLLWGVSGVATWCLCTALAGSMLAGQAPLRDPLPLAIIALSGIVTSLAWYLAFLPPAAWTRMLRRRAESRAALVA